MKILHVVNVSFVLPYFIGEQFDYFQEKGFELYVACTPDKFLYEYSEKKAFTTVPINILREFNIKEDLISIWKLSKVIKQEKIDIVIGHTPKGALIGLVAAKLAGVKNRVCFRHGLMYETSSGLKRTILKLIEKLTGSLASKVVCVSPSVLTISNQEGISSPKKNLLLNKGTCNGINAESKFNPKLINDDDLDRLRLKYTIKPTDRVVGYVGRLVNDKGINELIEAWKELINKYDDVRLLLVGPFEERDGISSSLQEYVLNEPSIIYTGLVNETVNFYSLMDVFILPSYREGFPTVVLEASAMELPVITTLATGCIDSIMENKTGVYTALNPKGIIEKIMYYLDNDILAKEHGRNGRKFIVDNFDQKVIWQEIEKKVLEV